MTPAWDNAVDVVSWVIVVAGLGWIVYRTIERSDSRSALIFRWIISAPFILYVLHRIHVHSPYRPLHILIPATFLGLLWTPNAVSAMFGPLFSMFDGGREKPEAKPVYSGAEMKRRKGLYNDAMAGVRKQLETFPGDYEGHVKLASIQMEDLKDLAAAEATLNEFLGYPGRSPGEVIGALHLLADWQLQANRDSKAAGENLQRIVDLYPGTPFAHAAQQRIAHLGSFNEAMRARYSTVFTVTPGKRGDNLHRADAPPPDPRVRVAELVEQLKLYPADTDAREELAVLYAAEFQRLDLAVEQLEQLIALPTEPPKHVARWLNLLATLHANYAHDQPAAEKALHRIMERFPGGALAALAASRLATVQTEIKTAQSTPTKVLGVYDKDLGLKSPGQ